MSSPKSLMAGVSSLLLMARVWYFMTYSRKEVTSSSVKFPAAVRPVPKLWTTANPAFDTALSRRALRTSLTAWNAVIVGLSLILSPKSKFPAAK